MPYWSISSSSAVTGSDGASTFGHVLEHVLRRELEVVERLVVAEVGAEEVVVVTAIGFGKPIIRSITPMSVGMGMVARYLLPR